jgi:hypothetical protein
VGRDSERVVQRTLESAPKGSDRCAADVRDASGFDDRVERRLVARVARSGLFGVTGPPVVRSGDGGHCADVESLVAFERRYRRAFTASDSFSAATDPTGPVSGASCRGPEGDSLKRSTRLNSGVEEWRSIATATKATLRSSIFRVKQDNSKQLSASPRTSVAIGCKPS